MVHGDFRWARELCVVSRYKTTVVHGDFRWARELCVVSRYKTTLAHEDFRWARQLCLVSRYIHDESHPRLLQWGFQVKSAFDVHVHIWPSFSLSLSLCLPSDWTTSSTRLPGMRCWLFWTGSCPPWGIRYQTWPIPACSSTWTRDSRTSKVSVHYSTGMYPKVSHAGLISSTTNRIGSPDVLIV